MSKYLLARPGAFTAEECDAIIALAATGRREAGPVYGGDGYHVDPRMRDVATSLIGRNAGNAWLFDRLDALFAEGAEAFGLPVDPIFEEIQVLDYRPGQHFQVWHSDAGPDRQERRRISLSVELSERADYDGGELEVVPDLVGRPRTLPRGSVQLFPSRALHHVTPVTRGRRWSLVAWTGIAAGT